MNKILEKILKHKKHEISVRSRLKSLYDIQKEAESCNHQSRNFINSIKAKTDNKVAAVIAEIKKASPSKGIIRENFFPSKIAIDYELNGATCLSVLTDREFFQGKFEYLEEARNACSLPVIQKDFIIEPYQVYEAKTLKADCILLIVSALTVKELQNLLSLSKKLEIDVLVEVHNEKEMLIALESDAKLIGINNRNLSTFEVNLNNTINLLNLVPDDISIVTESGIRTESDIKLMKNHDVFAFLVGEIFMKEESPGKKLRELFH